MFRKTKISFIRSSDSGTESWQWKIIGIILKEDSELLDEVVVVAYGTQKKINLTGSVTSVSTEDIKDRVQTDVLSAVQGTVPGLQLFPPDKK